MKLASFALALLVMPVLPLRSALAVQSLNAPSLGVQVPEEEKKREDFAHLNVDKKGLALSGYDPVAYFKEGGGKPLKGKKELVHKVGGVTYQFATKENLELFKKEPAKFEPAYGGWCAYAMAQDERVEIDPESFVIQDGKLMVFYDGFFSDTRAKWVKKPKEYQVKAEENWKKIITPKPEPKPDDKQS